MMSEEDWKADLSSSERLSTNFCIAISNAPLLAGTGAGGDCVKDWSSATYADSGRMLLLGLDRIEDLDITLLGAVVPLAK